MHREANLPEQLRLTRPAFLHSRRFEQRHPWTTGSRRQRKRGGRRRDSDGRIAKPACFFLLPASCRLPSCSSKSLPESNFKTVVVLARRQIPERALLVLRDE